MGRAVGWGSWDGGGRWVGVVEMGRAVGWGSWDGEGGGLG